MAEFKTRIFSQNEIIFKKGTRGDVAYILKEGAVEIYHIIDDEKIILADLSPVSLFGEMALLSHDQSRTATAVAIEYSECVMITKADLDNYIKKSPKVISVILTTLVDRLSKTSEKVTKRLPDVLVGTSEILNLLVSHSVADIKFDKTVKAIANSLAVDPKDVVDELKSLMSSNLLTMEKHPKKGRIIHITNKDDFLRQAMKIHRTSFTGG